jgi:hypothetical protein
LKSYYSIFVVESKVNWVGVENAESLPALR